jgi:hypothetical protein
MAEGTVDVGPAKTMEINHGPRYDMLLNTSAKNKKLVQELESTLVDGIPDDWDNVQTEGGGHEGYNYVDPEKRFFAKSRFISGVSFLRVFRKQTEVGSPKRKTQNAGNSIANEMLLAPKIRRALESEEALAAAHQSGFEKVEFVEPLVGLIDRQTGGKALVYEYIDGDEIIRNEVFPENVAAVKLIGQLREIFDKNGIIANDLDANERGPKQLLISKDRKTVYLLDAEQFVKK